MITIGLSTERIIESVYAQSALMALKGEDPAPLLHRGHEAALRRVARDAAALTALELAPLVADADLESDKEMITLSLETDLSRVNAAMVEAAVAYRVIALCSAGVDTRNELVYQSMSTTAIESIRRRAWQPRAGGTSIRPWMY